MNAFYFVVAGGEGGSWGGGWEFWGAWGHCMTDL